MARLSQAGESSFRPGGAGIRWGIPVRPPVEESKMKPVLEVSAVGMNFGGLRALNEVDLTVCSGEIVW